MNKEVIEEWICALESGEYKQGREALRLKGDNFCCLGVLCDLHAKSHEGSWVVFEEDEDADTDTDTSYTYKGRTDYLPEIVQLWAGITKTGPHGLDVSKLNDSGFSFAEIAVELRKCLNDNGI